MDKNWLIRTKSNHILGPVSKDKVIELFNNGSIKPDDEICSGNGFWFFIREEEMIDLYLKGSDVQGFNPISEAKDVLTQSTNAHALNRSQDEVTMVGNLNIPQMKKTSPTQPVKLAELSDAPVEKSSESSSKKKPKLEIVDRLPPTPREKKAHPSQKFLQYLVIFGFVILFCIVYFRRNLIRTIFKSSFSPISLIVAPAQAQEIEASEKKNS